MNIWTLTVEHPGVAPLTRWMLADEPSPEMLADNSYLLDELLLGVLWADTLSSERLWSLTESPV